MKNEPLFNRTLSVLVKAYREDTLVHGNCAACAVGNVIAAAMGLTITKSYGAYMWPNGHRALWKYVFMTDNRIGQIQRPFNYVGRIKEQIDSTGYTWRELADIEYAFEAAPRGNGEYNSDQHQLNGLLAVYDALCDIHAVSEREKKCGTEIFVK